MSDHDWTEENLDAYQAGGLSTEERSTIERHCAECLACAQQLKEGTQVDQLMNDVFAAIRPDAGLEDRALQRLPSKPLRRKYGIMHFALSAAAVIALGLIGAAAQAMVDGIGKPVRVATNVAGELPELENRSYFGAIKVTEGKEGRLDTAATEFNGDIKYLTDRMSDVNVPGSVNANEAVGIIEKTWTESLKQPDAGKDALANRESHKLGGQISGLSSGGASTPINGRTKEDALRGIQDLDGSIVNLPAPAGFGTNGSGGATSLGLSYYGRSGSTVNGPKSPPTNTPPPTKVNGGDSAENGKPRKEGLPSENKFSSDKREQYFSFGIGIYRDDPAKNPPANDIVKSLEKTKEAGYDQKKAEENVKERAAKNIADVVEKLVEQQPEPKLDANRKIIRTGEMEFETESFDAAVASVTTLITKVKGGFIATVNSDKLPNGKVRGAIVVRMPPETLDKFILDLRRELGKAGDLKGQRIGSQDVTKQYTDVESELRAARAVETRLIEIIKTGKGEIKDLIAAERELGTWRTKIEKMEGEIRFYNNQVSLSTLTITLSEKEILAATAMVLRERVLMSIEVEEVEKAQDSIAAGVKAAKGRIVKNDLSVGDAGQVSALVHVEVPPDSAPLFRELLKKLGTVAMHKAERTQQAEGGTSKAHEIKTRTDDVRFELTLYNTANIKPRETMHYRLGATDVAETYRMVREAVVKLKGQIRKSNLDEQDKLNVNAELIFNVATTDRAAIDKLIAAAGFVVTKHTIQAAINETATDRKVGYELTLLSTMNIKPRETYVMKIAAQDVVASYRKLRDAVEAAKGQIRKANLDEKDRLDVIADIAFHVAAGDRATIDKLLAEIGFVVNRQTAQAAVNEISTDRTVGYELTLRNVAAIPPRDIYTIALASQDVAASYRKLHEAVSQLKGRVHKGQLNEQDKFNVSAVLDFDLATADKPALDKLIGEIGVTISRNNDQFPSKDDSTDQKVGYRMTLKNVAGAAPREKALLALRVPDVDARASQLKELVVASKGRVMFSKSERNKNGETKMILVFELPHASLETIVRQIKDQGTVLVYDKELNPQVPDTELATAQITLTLVTPPDIVPTANSEEGLSSMLRAGLSLAFTIFSWCLVLIISGLAVVVPFAVPVWIVLWLVRRNKANAVVVVEAKKCE